MYNNFECLHHKFSRPTCCYNNPSKILSCQQTTWYLHSLIVNWIAKHDPKLQIDAECSLFTKVIQYHLRRIFKMFNPLINRVLCVELCTLYFFFTINISCILPSLKYKLLFWSPFLYKTGVWALKQIVLFLNCW